MNPVLYWTAVVGGSVHGALYDPLVWVMIVFVALAGLSSQFRWWMPALLALAFNAIHITTVLPVWLDVLNRHDTWMLHALRLLAIKLLIAHAVAGLVRSIQWLWRRLTQKPSVETAPPA